MNKYLVSLTIGSLLLVMGMIILVIDGNRYQYINHLPHLNYDIKKINLKHNLNNQEFRIKKNPFINIQITSNKTLAKDEMLIKGLYYHQFIDLDLVIKDRFYYQELLIDAAPLLNYHLYNELFNDYLRHFKTKKIYNYSLLFKPALKIYINKDSQHLIKLID